MDDWPDCPTEGCNKKACLTIDSPWCFDHTPGNRQIKHWKADLAQGHELSDPEMHVVAPPAVS